jgi:hypothetical protein
MRAAPPIIVTIARFGVWRGFVAGLCAVAAAVFAAWVLLRLELAAPLAPALLAGALAGGLSMLLSRRQPMQLGWDGQTWSLDGLSHTLEPAIDAGAWMLLRLRPLGLRAPTVWLPVQRYGLETAWHALRAAVYSPRPMMDASSPAAPND